MKSPILIYRVEADGAPFDSEKVLDTQVSEKLHRYLLELDTFPNKDPSLIIISETFMEVSEYGPSGEQRFAGFKLITASGNTSFYCHSRSFSKDLGTCPELVPIRLRQGWAVWLPKTDSRNELRVRIYSTKSEAEAACVLFGG